MPTTQLRRGGSDAAEPWSAVGELHRQIGGPDLAFALVFCSPQYDLSEVAAAIRHHFGDTRVFGCTTAGEITPFGYISGGLSGIGFPASDFAVAPTLFQDLKDFKIATTIEQTRLAMAARAESAESGSLGPSDGFALLLVDGMSVREEQLVSAIGNTLNGTPLVGGSAGDGMNFGRSYVFCDGRFVDDAAVLLLITTRRRFSVFKTEHFVPTDCKMVVTGADLEQRRVYEINAEPAAMEYARLVGLAGKPLSPKIFAAHPVMVRVGGQYHVRAIQKVNPDNSLTFLCAIDEGIVLTVAKGVDLLEDLKSLFRRLQRDVGPPDLIIGCDCVLRNLEIEERRLKSAVSDLFVEQHVVGFCTYGEQYMSMHVNQTFTGVIIGAP
ncbi:MAG TPA: nitric oxide-sensing protein NosP [Aliidongia sp.]|uniref:nitric oxide-sensing protein NosP n=1 Tax=Aliidongia sp. TaxID=1914230 RepID=UPI002DDD5685|nr:nitric oxide-sensing protein NosP [Aliidongia sp.]HEV2677440.1 nitric oxide-sensing protein NosP [Aliidongia sp.]